MSGLFQRIARRRAGDPDGAEAPTPEQPAGEAAAAADAPTRYIGAPAPEPAPQTEQGAADPGETTAQTEQAAADPGETTAFASGDQPTALFPLADQSTEAHAPLPSDAALSAAATGSTPQSVGAPATGEQPTPPAAGDQPTGEQSASGEQPTAPIMGEQPPATGEQVAASQPLAPVEHRPGFRERGRMRRRLRYLRRLRELQVRDLGGLAFDLRRFERKRDDLVAQKIDQIRACDDELTALETALEERRDIRDVRLPGIGGTCPRCFSLYGSSDRFCAHCGAALGGLAQGPAQVAAPPPPPPASPALSAPAAQVGLSAPAAPAAQAGLSAPAAAAEQAGLPAPATPPEQGGQQALPPAAPSQPAARPPLPPAPTEPTPPQ